jgi:hypothetical protein
MSPEIRRLLWALTVVAVVAGATLYARGQGGPALDRVAGELSARYEPGRFTVRQRWGGELLITATDLGGPALAADRALARRIAAYAHAHLPGHAEAPVQVMLQHSRSVGGLRVMVRDARLYFTAQELRAAIEAPTGSGRSRPTGASDSGAVADDSISSRS